MTGPGRLDPAHFPDDERPQRYFMEVVGRGDAVGHDGLSGMASSGAGSEASHQGRNASRVQHRVEQVGAARTVDASQRGASFDQV